MKQSTGWLVYGRNVDLAIEEIVSIKALGCDGTPVSHATTNRTVWLNYGDRRFGTLYYFYVGW